MVKKGGSFLTGVVGEQKFHDVHDNVVRVLSAAEAPTESFHDCHVHGIGWNSAEFSLWLEIDYIVKWLAPPVAGAGYRFLVARAKVVFANVDNASISLAWEHTALTAQIDDIVTLATRATPSGAIQNRYEATFAEPAGSVGLWSTGYTVVLAHDPVLTTVPRIP